MWQVGSADEAQEGWLGSLGDNWSVGCKSQAGLPSLQHQSQKGTQ